MSTPNLRLTQHRGLLRTSLVLLLVLVGCYGTGTAGHDAAIDSAAGRGQLATAWLEQWSVLAEHWKLDAPRIESDDEFDPFGACGGCGCWSP